MQVIDYGVFENVLYSYVKNNFNNIRNTDKKEDFTAALLQLDNRYKVVINKDTSSKYRTGKRPLNDDIIKMFIGPKVRKNVIENFKYSIIGLVPRGQTKTLIRDFVTLVEADTEMDDDLKEQILSEANPKQITEFLADILIYAVQIDPTRTNTALRDLSGSALTVLIDEAVPEVVKRVLALQYIKFDDSPEIIDALKENRFGDFVDTLVRERRMSGKEYFQWRNILKIADMAQDELAEVAEKGSDSYVPFDFDADWYTRFFDFAGNISDEDMQQLWAKLLAGEVTQHNRFSKATLGVLYDMDSKDAQHFAYVSQLIVKNIVDYPNITQMIIDNGSLRYFDIGQYNLRPLIECGLLNSLEQDHYLSRVYDDSSDDDFFTNENERLVLHISRPAMKKGMVPFDFYSLTRAGRELLPLVQNANDEYLFFLGKVLRLSFDKELTVEIHKTLLDVSDSAFEQSGYDKRDLLEEYIQHDLDDCEQFFSKEHDPYKPSQIKKMPVNIGEFIESIGETHR